MPSPMLEFRILGPLSIRLDGTSVSAGGPKQRALLALLLLSANRVVSRDRLVAELFPEQSVNSADHALRNHVSRLRKALSPLATDEPRVVARAPGYLLRVEPGELDLETFERLAEEGRERLAAGESVAAAEALRGAEALWQGRPLADLEFEPFARIDVERLEELRLAVVESRVDADLALGRHRELVPELESLCNEHPFRERFRAQLMLALYRSGRQAESLEIYQRTRRLLDEELGLLPGGELQALERSILLQDPMLDARPTIDRHTSAPPARDVCPFKGLAPFEVSDAEFFFGRERLTDEIVSRLADSPFVAIIGASGSGKSSLLRAGLLSSLARGSLPGSERWRQIVIRPADRPGGRLSRQLEIELPKHLERVPPGQRVVVAVDQAEELFGEEVGEQERRAFVNQLVEAAWDAERRAVVLVALRADFVGAIAPYAEFADLVAGSQVLLGPPSGGELHRTIERPAACVGLEVEPELVDELVAQVSGAVGGLPLLSTALLDLWRMRSDRTLTLASYERTGGLEGVIGRFAEDAFLALDGPSKDIARRILVRLVAGGGAEPLTRRRLERAQLELDVGAGTDGVVSTLVDRRLLVAHDDSVELVHDALLERWERLAGWLAEDADARRLRDRLARSASEWDAGGRDSHELLRGARLAAALESAESANITGLELEFLEASRIAAAHEAEQQRRANRRLRTALAAALVLLLIAIAAGVIATKQRRHARNDARAADAQRLGAEALGQRSLDRSLLLAREAVALDESPTTRADLLASLLRSPAAIAIGHPSGSRVLDETLSPDGRTLAVRGDDGTVIAFDTHTLRRVGAPISGSDQIGLMGATAGPLHALSYTPNGKMLGIGSTTGTSTLLQLVDTQTHVARWSADDNAENVADLFFSPDGSKLATGEPVTGRFRAPPERVVVRSTRTGRTLAESAQLAAARLAGYTPDGRRLLVTEGDRESLLLDSRTLKPLRRFALGGATALAPKEAEAAFGGSGGTVTLLDLTTGVHRALPGRIDGTIETISFSPDGTRLATGSDNGLVGIWNNRLGLIETFAGHAADVRGALFSPDGQTLYTAASDGNVIAWDLGGSRRLGRPFQFAPTGPGVAAYAAVSPDGKMFATSPGPGRVTLRTARALAPLPRELRAPVGDLTDLFFSPDGRLLAAAGSTGTAVWNIPTRHVAHTFDSGIREGAMAYAPTGTAIATAPNQTSVIVHDLRTGRQIAVFPAHGIDALRFSPDASLLAGASLDGSVTVWNLNQRTVAARLKPGAVAVYTIAISHNGKLLAVGDSGGTATLYDVARGRRTGPPLTGNSGGVSGLAFSPDDKTLAAVGNDGALRLWDVTTHRLNNVLPGSTSGGSTVFFPDGRHVLTVFFSGTGIVWDVDPADWAARACRVANRNLTRTEWREFLPNRRYDPACGENFAR